MGRGNGLGRPVLLTVSSLGMSPEHGLERSQGLSLAESSERSNDQCKTPAAGTEPAKTQEAQQGGRQGPEGRCVGSGCRSHWGLM